MPPASQDTPAWKPPGTSDRAGSARGQAPPWRPKTLREWIDYAPTEYLHCFDEGHQWGVDGWRGSNVEYLRDGSVLLEQECTRCGLPRDRWLGPAGEVDGSRNVYHYNRMRRFDFPYLMPGVARDKAARAAIRVELRRRETEGRPRRVPPGQQQVVTPFRSAKG
jgi:hypothetical protein